MKILNSVRKIGLACAFSTLAYTPSLVAQVNQNFVQDSFVTSTIPPEGTYDKKLLANAPKPFIKIVDKNKTAKIVVDLSKNILYKYDVQGKPEVAYLIASGKKSTPTHTGVRIVTHKETFPYRGAPRSSKRRRNPRAYGPKIICLNILDPKTGEQRSTGEFIHGTNNPEALGEYVSHGCMRMDNDVIQDLALEVKQGDIVIIKR